MAGEPRRLVVDPLHQAAVAGDHPGPVIDQIVAEHGVEMPLGDRHADRHCQALAERPGGRLDAVEQEILGMAGAGAAELAEVGDLLDRRLLVAGQVEQGVDQHRAVAGRQHEAVAVVPFGSAGIVLQIFGEQDRRRVGHAHRHAGMARIGGLRRRPSRARGWHWRAVRFEGHRLPWAANGGERRSRAARPLKAGARASTGAPRPLPNAPRSCYAARDGAGQSGPWPSRGSSGRWRRIESRRVSPGAAPACQPRPTIGSRRASCAAPIRRCARGSRARSPRSTGCSRAGSRADGQRRGRDRRPRYYVACRDGEEEHLRSVAAIVDRKRMTPPRRWAASPRPGNCFSPPCCSPTSSRRSAPAPASPAAAAAARSGGRRSARRLAARMEGSPTGLRGSLERLDRA